MIVALTLTVTILQLLVQGFPIAKELAEAALVEYELFISKLEPSTEQLNTINAAQAAAHAALQAV